MSREIQDRINSIKDTMKITNAMYMISSTKMKTGEEKADRYRAVLLRTAGRDRQNPAACAGYRAPVF